MSPLNRCLAILAIATFPLSSFATPPEEPQALAGGIAPAFAEPHGAPMMSPVAAPNDEPGPIEDTLNKALGLIGIPYKWGSANPAKGLDCSGLVQHVFQQSRDLLLPRSAREQSKEGEKVDKKELAPGDLVFFNTMRRAFSHVGIYLGDGLFVHAPRRGQKVRVDSMESKYWTRRYNGARRVTDSSN